METESVVAVFCAAIALVMLIALTIFTLVKSWKQISRELAEREQREAANSYDNVNCIENEHALNDDNFDIKSSGQDHGENANTSDHTEAVGTALNDQEVNERSVVQVDINDTSF